MKSNTKVIIVLAGLVLVGSCAVACLAVGGLVALAPLIMERRVANSSLPVGQTAPDFELATLNGGTLHLSDFRGQPVLLTFGASWCPDCIGEAPLLQALHERGSNLVVLMVDMQEDQQTVWGYADQYGFTFPVALDYDGAVSKDYQVFAIPTNLLIDENGIIRARIIEQVTEEKLEAMLKEANIELTD